MRADLQTPPAPKPEVQSYIDWFRDNQGAIALQTFYHITASPEEKAWTVRQIRTAREEVAREMYVSEGVRLGQRRFI